MPRVRISGRPSDAFADPPEGRRGCLSLWDFALLACSDALPSNLPPLLGTLE